MRLLARLPLTVLLAAIGALAMLVPAAYSLALGDGRMAGTFAISAGVLLALAAVTGLAAPAAVGTRAMLLNLLAAVTLVPVILAVPLWIALPETGLFNAWWEMVSCLTTTGASLHEPQSLDAPLHLWRALVGWLGGLFMLVAATAIMAPLRIGGFEIVPDRGHRLGAPRAGGADPAMRILQAGAAVAPVYAGLTLGLWVLLLMLGDPGLAALGRAMGTLSTSGILVAPVASGIAGEVAVFAFLILALSRRFWPGGAELRSSETLRHDPELRLAAGVVVLVALILLARHFIEVIEAPDPGHAGQPVRALAAAWGGLFNALSYLTTTGWNSVEWPGARQWSGFDSPGLLLAGLAIMGGGVATAAGGVKLLRVHALAAHALREMEKLPHPHSVGGGGRTARWMRGEGAFLAFVFFMLFALSLAVIVSLLSLQRIEFEDATILAIAALTNTGQLAGTLSLAPVIEGGAGTPWGGWAGLPAFARTILAGAMILGRIETLALLALFNPEIWRR
ncbi:TrkH family potassium uptake protein [uncultured Paracoccus sp.]|uniref:TrkH family potassium uptake protein n=1 Tax=uncultured Paracoccus sp. TaxID=189685 RepID=UPI0025DF47DD|nr:TrkH family potassium uptake protein [uncultured Paracoccus sp.]